MPSGIYVLNVLDSVTDLVGNPLDGKFSGVFPSGTASLLQTSLTGLATSLSSLR